MIGWDLGPMIGMLIIWRNGNLCGFYFCFTGNLLNKFYLESYLNFTRLLKLDTDTYSGSVDGFCCWLVL